MDLEPINTEFFEWLKENRQVADHFPPISRGYYQPISFPTSVWWETNSKLIPEKFHPFLKLVFSYEDYYAPFLDAVVKTPDFTRLRDTEESNALEKFLTKSSTQDKVLKIELDGKTHKVYFWCWLKPVRGWYERVSAWGYEDPISKRITYRLVGHSRTVLSKQESDIFADIARGNVAFTVRQILTRIRRHDQKTIDEHRAKATTKRVKAMFRFGEDQEQLVDATKILMSSFEDMIKEAQANESNYETLDAVSAKIVKTLEALEKVKSNTFCGTTAKQTKERLYVDVTSTMPPREPKKKGKK